MKKVLAVLLAAGLVVGIYRAVNVPDVSCDEDSDTPDDFLEEVSNGSGNHAPYGGGQGGGSGGGQPG